MRSDVLQLPPLLTGHPLAASEDPFAEAVEAAAQGRLGAGDLVWSRDPDRVELALVLEPEVAFGRAVEIAPLLWVAIMEALAGAMPPKTSLILRWPDVVLVNGGEVGRLDFAAATKAAGEVPDWLVVGACLQLATIGHEREPGESADRTSLAEEGGAEIEAHRLLGSIGAHLLTWINIWQDEGFPRVRESWIGRVEGHDCWAPIRHGGASWTGRIIGIDETRALVVELAGDGGRLSLPLADLFQLREEMARS